MRRSVRRLRAAADGECYTANLTMVSTYSSKIDVWLAAVVTLGAIVAAAAAWQVAVAPIPGKWAIVLPILLIGVALPAWIFLATRYTLTQTDLLVRSGPFRWLVPLRAIDRVVPTRCPLSSPALSLDRLRIDYGGGRSIMISPRARETFLQDLDRRRSDNML
jgi:membrane protein YdbS with pleckstrin-like domain